MKIAIHCGLMLLMFIASGSAQQMNEKDSPCTGTAVTSDLVDCLSKAQKSADTTLNSAYKNVLDYFRNRREDTERLRTAERLWLQYRDANCDAERGLYDVGTGASPAYLACVESMTRARTKELKVMYGWLLSK
jgi:uncharacterized protein YecT (DUF1311 family)